MSTKGWSVEARKLRVAKHKERFPINVDFFKVISPNLVYFLGYVAGDGVCCSNGFSFSVGSKDKEMVELFRDAMAPRYKLGVHEGVWYLQCCNKELWRHINNFDVKNPSIFNRIPNKFLKDFIRGFLDSDGCIRKRKSGIQSSCLEVSFVQKNKVFLESLKEAIKELGCKSSEIGNANNCNYFVLGHKEGVKLLGILYKHYENIWFLRRKYLVYKTEMYRRGIDVNPLFDYVCSGCGDERSELVSKADDIVLCTKCNIPMSRKFPSPNVIVKGHKVTDKEAMRAYVSRERHGPQKIT